MPFVDRERIGAAGEATGTGHGWGKNNEPRVKSVLRAHAEFTTDQHVWRDEEKLWFRKGIQGMP